MSQQVGTQDQAVSILIQAAQVAQKRGAFNLEEAALIAQAATLIAPHPVPDTTETKEEDSEQPE